MKVAQCIKNRYVDSVALMSTTARLKKTLGFRDLVLLMGTPMNKEMMDSVGLMDDVFTAATPNDLMCAAHLDDDSQAATWLEDVLSALEAQTPVKNATVESYKTIRQAQHAVSHDVALISVPGTFAAAQAHEALDQGLHVMLFSDNVSVEDEIALKDKALNKDLLVMGPDCGTAIINGVGLCFANAVRKGSIGCVAASGTGLQEVTVIIDRFGGGISHAIGVGGRDLSEAVGGRMMLKGIDALQDDPSTEVIVLISKPPHPSVEKKIAKRLQTITKPVVVCFLDSAPQSDTASIRYARTLSEAAQKALAAAHIETPEVTSLSAADWAFIHAAHERLQPSQTELKGLYCGGTLTAESLSLLREDCVGITSNVAKKDHEKMLDPLQSQGHNLVDLGDDLFTQGRPHPMIEPSIRLERILKEASRSETAVLLLDFELGYGSHEDPVGVTLETLQEAQAIALKAGRYLPMVAYVCGTPNDAQSLTHSETALHALGIHTAQTNAHAALIAAAIVKEVKS